MNNTIIIDSKAPSAWEAVAGHSWHAVLLRSIKHGIAQIGEHRRLRRDTDVLLALDDRMLADIGLRRCEVEYAPATAGASRIPRPTATVRPAAPPSASRKVPYGTHVGSDR